MPKVIFTGINEKDLLVINKELIDELSNITGTGREIFKFKLDESKYMFDGEYITPYATVDVYWFERPQEIQDACAKAITNYIANIGYPGVDVVFHTLHPHKYYEEGEHL